MLFVKKKKIEEKGSRHLKIYCILNRLELKEEDENLGFCV